MQRPGLTSNKYHQWLGFFGLLACWRKCSGVNFGNRNLLGFEGFSASLSVLAIAEGGNDGDSSSSIM